MSQDPGGGVEVGIFIEQPQSFDEGWLQRGNDLADSWGKTSRVASRQFRGALERDNVEPL